jgi:outer membrane protein OmpU
MSGYYQFYALTGAIEGSYALNGTSAQYKGLQFIQNGEIFFTGQAKLDNGTSVGVRVELEAWDPSPGSTGSNRQIDKAYMFASGDWGRLEFGAKDDAAYIMYYGAPSALLGFGFFKHNTDFSWTNPTANGFNMAAFHISASTIDAEYGSVNRINYYTPRFAGLQIGLSYAPKIQPKTQPGSIWALTPGPGKTSGICGFSDATTANGCPTNDNSWQDAIAIGANYLNKFGDLSIGIYVAYSYMSFIPGLTPAATAANTVNGANLTSWKQAVIGVQLNYGGFTVGGSFGWDNNGIGSNYYTRSDNDTRTWAASIMYETGPWQMSAGFAIAINDNGNGTPSIIDCKQGATSSCSVAVAATTADYFGTHANAGSANFGAVTASKIELGANYVIGPGVRIVGGAIFNNLSGPSNAVAGQSWAALLGMDVHF